MLFDSVFAKKHQSPVVLSALLPPTNAQVSNHKLDRNYIY